MRAREKVPPYQKNYALTTITFVLLTQFIQAIHLSIRTGPILKNAFCKSTLYSIYFRRPIFAANQSTNIFLFIFYICIKLLVLLLASKFIFKMFAINLSCFTLCLILCHFCLPHFFLFVLLAFHFCHLLFIYFCNTFLFPFILHSNATQCMTFFFNFPIHFLLFLL